MDINEYIKSIKKQTETVENTFTGISSIQNVLNSYKVPFQDKNYLNSINNITKLTSNFRSYPKNFDSIISNIGASNLSQNVPDISSIGNLANLTKQFALSNKNTNHLVSSNISELLKGIGEIPKHNFALSGIASSIALLSENNKLLANNITKVASSQLLLSNNISEMTKHFKNSHLQQFNGLSMALQSVSNSFLNDTFKSRNWENLSTIKIANEVIISTADEYIEKEILTIEDLNEFKSSVLIELNSLLTKTKTEKPANFILHLIAVIGFIITLYTTLKPESDITNIDVLNETKKEIKKLNDDIAKSIQNEFLKLNKIRISKTNVNLRFSTKKRSKIIGVVLKNQEVTVIEIRHKFLLISYLDKKTLEPKSGFVVKKYFRKK